MLRQDKGWAFKSLFRARRQAKKSPLTVSGVRLELTEKSELLKYYFVSFSTKETSDLT